MKSYPRDRFIRKNGSREIYESYDGDLASKLLSSDFDFYICYWTEQDYSIIVELHTNLTI